MKVLHLVKTAVGATWALRQIRELVKLGVEIHVALPVGPLVVQYQAAGAYVHLFQTDLFSLPIGEWLTTVKNFRSLIYLVQPDLIHSHFLSSTLLMRAILGKKHSLPRIFQVPSPLHLQYGFYRSFELALAGPADYWVASCRWSQNCYLAAGIEPQRVFLSYYGVDLAQFANRPRGKLRAELHLSPHTRILGLVAFMYPPKKSIGQTRGSKGHEDFIDALMQLNLTEEDVVGVLIGGAWSRADWYETQIRTYAKMCDPKRFIFLGTRNDVLDLYPDIDIAIHPSHAENVGGACESLLMGVPTITTNVGGFPDIVKPAETGWLVSPGAPAQLAAAIQEALADLPHARNLARHGQILTRTLFDVQQTASEIANIYKLILSEH